MDLAQLKELLKVVSESDVAEVEIEEEGTKIVVRRSAPTVTVQPSTGFPSPYGYYPVPYGVPPPSAAAPAPAAAAGAPPPPPLPTPQPSGAAPSPEAEAAQAPQAEVDRSLTVRAPIVGTFYRSPSPEADPFVKVGDAVKPGDVLCIIEAMKLMNEIECEVAGTIQQVLVEDAMAVEYDQPLFLIEPT